MSPVVAGLFSVVEHKAIKRTALAFSLALLSVSGHAQTYTQVEVITYSDNTSLWVIGQKKKSVVDGIEATNIEYNNMAKPSSFSEFGQVKQSYVYDEAKGTLSSITDANGNTTSLSGWMRGIPQSIVFEDETYLSAVVSPKGWIDSVTDENRYKTTYGYDDVGRVNAISYPLGDVIAWNSTLQPFVAVNSIEYGIPAGHWKQTVQTGNGFKVTYYDALWRPLLISEYDSGNLSETQRFLRFEYNGEGRVTFASYPSAQATASTGIWTEYDSLGRNTSVSQDSELGLLTTSSSYQDGFVKLSVDARSQQTKTFYKAFDQPKTDWPIAILQPENAFTSINRNNFGKPLTITRQGVGGAHAVTRTYSYNGNQELCKSVDPESGATLYGYDPAGNLKWSASGLTASAACEVAGASTLTAARRIDRTYDERNRLETLSFPDGDGDQVWTYTPDGLPAGVLTSGKPGTPSVTNLYIYNKRRLLTSETQQLSGWADYTRSLTYNQNGHLASTASNFDGPTLDYTPNAVGQPTKIGTFATDIKYHPNGAVKSFKYGNGVFHSATINDRLLPERSIDCISAGACSGTDKRFDFSYSFDPNGNVTHINDGVNGRQNRGMVYDGLNRLIQVTSNIFGTASYQYDEVDNLDRVSVTAGRSRDYFYCYDEHWRLTNIKEISCAGPSVEAFGYDEQGNLANRNGVLYQFDFGNRLRDVAGKESGFTYDAHGRRAYSTRLSGETGDLRSVYGLDGRLVFQQDQGQSWKKDYIYLGENLIAERMRPSNSASPVTVSYQHTDALGTPIVVTDAGKNISKTFEYEPYGALVSGSLASGPGFTGHMQDAATGLTYMQQRYYDPAVGRFLSVDPVTAYESGDWRFFNRYAYAFNSPYAFKDYDGRCPVCPVVVFFVLAMTHSESANAPAPGEKTQGGSAADALDAVPGGGPAVRGVRMTVSAVDKLSQRAANREARRQAAIPTSQQASSQTNGRASDGTPVGRQQSYEVPKEGGGTEIKSVQVSRDMRGDHAGQPQIEAGAVKPGGQTDAGGRPRIQNEDKVRVDFDPNR